MIGPAGNRWPARWHPNVLADDRRPPDTLWSETLVSCRLLEYELWTRVNARGLAQSHDEAVRALLGRLVSYDERLVAAARQLKFAAVNW